MKYFLFIIILIITVFIHSCKNKNKKQPVATNKNTEALETNIDNFNYSTDSTGNIAYLVINPDGTTEYKQAKQDRIFRQTASGLEFRYITVSGKLKKPKVGDVLYIDMIYKTEKDSVIFDSKNIDKDNFMMQLNPQSHTGGCIEEAFSMLSEGDSAVFRIDAMNFLNYTQRKLFIPDYVKNGDKFLFCIKMKKIVDGSDYVKENAEMYSYYLEQEKSLIERYVLELNYPRSIQKSGLNVIPIKKTGGKKVSNGNKVIINYTSSFLDGTVFDSTIERNESFSFTIGKNEVIEGLEEAVKLMQKGEHYIFIIPFRLAYGEKKYNIIPPFTTLVFEIELLDVQ